MNSFFEKFARFLGLFQGEPTEAAKRAAQFAKRVVMLDEMTEGRQIQNLTEYLKASERVIEQLRAAGAPDAVLQKAILELQVAPAMAQRNALIMVRHAEILLNETVPNTACDTTVNSVPPPVISQSERDNVPSAGENGPP